MSVVIVAACFGIVGSQLPPPQGSQSLTLGYKPSPLRGLDLGLALEGRRIVAQGEALRTLGIQARTLSVGARTLGTNAKPLPPITALAVAPDSKSILAGSQSGIQILTYPDLKPDRTLPTELLNIHDLAFSPDGKSFAVAGGIPGKRGMVELFTWPEGKLLQRLKPHSDLIYAIAWRSDSSAFASASADRTVCLIDAKSGKTTKSFEGHSRGVLCAVFLPNGELLTAGIDESLRLWDLKTGESLRTLANHTKQVNGGATQFKRCSADDRLGQRRPHRSLMATNPRSASSLRAPGKRAASGRLDSRRQLDSGCLQGRAHAHDRSGHDGDCRRSAGD